MIIGIAGGSGSGKTTIATKLAEPLNANVLTLDDYFKNPATFPVIYGHPDYDRLEAVDFDSAIATILQKKDNLIVEGFLILAYPKLRRLFDISFFIDNDPNILATRRIIRDPDTNKDYIVKHVQKQYEHLVLPTKQYADLVLDGALSVNKLIDEIRRYIGSKVSYYSPSRFADSEITMV